ncbi:MAG: HAMP domain-containing sensor histidine kinase [Caulobacteraceae bacterium]
MQGRQPADPGGRRRRAPADLRTPDEIDMLAGIANRMMDEVERLLWAVKSVGDNVAHDLRTPLTRLRALLYRAEQQAAEDDPHAPMLRQALAETDALLARFKALQRISEIDRRERRAGVSPVALGALVHEGRRAVRAPGRAAGPDARGGERRPRRDPADRELLFEALVNLLGNAIKFTPAGGRVTLRLTAQAEGPRLEVIDSGPGVDEGRAGGGAGALLPWPRRPRGAGHGARPQHRRRRGAAARIPPRARRCGAGTEGHPGLLAVRRRLLAPCACSTPPRPGRTPI